MESGRKFLALMVRNGESQGFLGVVLHEETPMGGTFHGEGANSVLLLLIPEAAGRSSDEAIGPVLELPAGRQSVIGAWLCGEADANKQSHEGNCERETTRSWEILRHKPKREERNQGRWRCEFS
jgi:hypothetical protein